MANESCAVQLVSKCTLLKGALYLQKPEWMLHFGNKMLPDDQVYGLIRYRVNSLI